MKRKENKVYPTKKKLIIYTIEDDNKGLRLKPESFVNSTIGSSLFGSRGKDEIYHPDNSDVDVRIYDYFKKETEEEKEAKRQKYGTAYPEFAQVTKEDIKKYMGDEEFEPSKYNQAAKDASKEEKAVVEPTIFSKNVSNIDFENKNFEIEDIEDDLEENNIDSTNEEIKIIDSIDDLKEELNQTEEPSFEEQYGFEFLGDSLDGLSSVEEIEAKVKEENEIEVKQTSIPTYSIQENTENKALEDIEINAVEEPKPIIKHVSNYVLPDYHMFRKGESSVEETPEWVNEYAETINETLASFDVAGSVVNATVGPSFSRFEVKLEPGVPVNKVTRCEDNLKMDLGVENINILAPIPGKKTIGIEVGNKKTKTVYFGDLLSEEYINDGSPLTAAIGKDIDNNIIKLDVGKMPHGLIAGGSGSGKSVCVNTIICSLLLKNKPDELKFILIDPKMLEFNFYDQIPHLATPVITDPNLASYALKWACDEMGRRLEILKDNHVKDLAGYNAKAKNSPYIDTLPYIVIIVDEFADLMLTNGNDVVTYVNRIAAKARAVGIHLLLATQRPTVEFVPGSIKANIAARIALKVSSATDSMTILDRAGAEKLLGHGDLLLKVKEDPIRVQGAYIPDDEITSLVDYCINEEKVNYLFTHESLEKQYNTKNDEVVTSTSAPQPDESKDDDVLYNVALFIINEGKCSINSVVRFFNMGYNKAASYVTQLERMGIIGPNKGTTSREVLANEEQLMEIFNKKE